jgi:hypothetical protein
MAAKIQYAMATTDAHDEPSLGEDYTDRPGIGARR